MPSIFERITNDIQDRYNTARNTISREIVLNYSIIILIFILAFLLRILSSFKYEIILAANDPYSQLRAATYIEQNGLFEFFKWVDPQTWYPEGRYWGTSQYIGTPLSAVLIHQFLLMIGFEVPLVIVAYYQPAIFGAIAAVIIYFLGKEIGNRKVGLLASLLLAISPGYIQRTSAGFFDNESLGMLLLLLSLYLYLRSLRTGSLSVGVLAGITLGFLSASWGAATYAMNLISLHAFVLILGKKHSDRLTTTFGSSVITAMMISIMIPRNSALSLLNTDNLIPLGVLGLILLIDISKYLTTIYDFSFLKKRKNQLIPVGVIGIVIAAVMVFVLGLYDNLSSKFITTLFPFIRDSTPILKSVSEHQIVTWATFYRNANILILLLPLGAYYMYQKPTERNLMLLIFTLTSTYFAGSMVRLAIIMAPATSLMAAKTVDQTLIPFVLAFQDRFALSKRKTRLYTPLSNEHTAFAFLTLGAFLMFSILISTNLITASVSPASILTVVPEGQSAVIGNDWQEAIAWLDYNTNPNTDVIASWWDYGYWISANSNVTILVDNATINRTKIANVGCMLVLNPRESLKIAKIYDVTYMVVLLSGGYGSYGFDSDIGKVPWFVRIGEAGGSITDINQTDYLRYDSRDQYIEAYVDKFYDSVFWSLMTQGITQDTYTYLRGYNPISVESPETVDSAGFSGDYVEYGQYYELAYETSHDWIRIWRINWDVIPPNAIAP